MTIAEFPLAFAGAVTAVRRPTRKREIVLTLVDSSIVIAWMIVRVGETIAVWEVCNGRSREIFGS